MRHAHPFTLIEILCAIAILLILAGIAIGGLTHGSERSDRARTLATMSEIQVALEAFYADYGSYPIGSGDLRIDQDKADWKLFRNETRNKRNRPYLENAKELETISDAYGNPFQYEYPNLEDSSNTTAYRLWSMGKDGSSASGKQGDDLCSWKQN